MRNALKLVYATVVIVVMAFLARTCFGVRGPRAMQTSAAPPTPEALHAAAAVDTTRPADASQYTVRPGPQELLANDSLSGPLFTELAARYQPALADFKTAAAGAGAKLVVVSFGVDGGKHATELERRADSVIRAAAKTVGVPYYDFAGALDSATAAGASVTIDKDGHVSKIGSALVAAGIARILDSIGGYRSAHAFGANERPTTFGDFKPLEDDVVDLGNGHPYLLKVNSQGLRMNFDLGFPKTKQRVLLMGSSLAYFPFIDNDKTATGLLQAKYPSKEFLNAAMLAFGIRDDLELFIDKTQYAEPDILILQQSGMDIVRLFFTIRNFEDRARRYHPPSPLEKAWYAAHYPGK
ncbi:MAG: hypothetical protein ABI442_19475 [Gemmatimonadaceae bacterium]